MANPFVPGDLVISIYGDGNNDGTYTDNQASPIVLEDISTTGTVGGSLVLPQTARTVNGVTQNAISGEYGSSSEGTLQLSADGQSLTIAGYAINAATYNNAEAGVSGSKAAGGVYGNNALAQTYSVPNGGTNGAPAGVTPVARVVADVRADGTVDTSTALLNIDNENNPRSVVTNEGRSFYIAGQGVKGDTTQGLFYATDGAASTSATAINTSTDQRTVEIYNGNVYVSTDSKQGTGANKFTANISEYSGNPTAAATPTILPGISQSVTLTAAQENGINNGQVGKAVNLSPENFYFASSTTLYVADGGQPKGGGLGDGGLQKYTFSNNTWNLDYTLSAGLNLVANTGTSGTTGLIGLTGQIVGGNVQLYATNSTIGDLDPTFLYGITDNLAATTAPSGESFTQLAAAANDTNIRGVAFAPQVAVCFAQGTRIATTRGNVAVEALNVGDLAVTASGAHRPIRWIGSRLTHCRRHPSPNEVMPVRVCAHAFGKNRPSRDLLVSPGHSLCIDVVGEVLIPAGSLINGTTIVQEDVDHVTYWHVELEGGHDILLAENMPTESYLEMGNRGFFAENGVVALDASPDAPVVTHADFCRPFHAEGALVEVVRAQLAARATRLGWRLEEQGSDDLHLLVDGVRIEPRVRGLSARFTVPAGAQAVWLVSGTTIPAEIAAGSPDRRSLGVCCAALTIDDGFDAPRGVSLDDPNLCVGFHALEHDGAAPMRWTAGRARLPACLWEGVDDDIFLRVDLAMPALPRWVAPAAVMSSAGLALVG